MELLWSILWIAYAKLPSISVRERTQTRGLLGEVFFKADACEHQAKLPLSREQFPIWCMP